MIADHLAEKNLREEPDDDEDDAAGSNLVRHGLVPLEVVGVYGVTGSLGTLVEVLVLSGKEIPMGQCRTTKLSLSVGTPG
jgi:hypothetical protein